MIEDTENIAIRVDHTVQIAHTKAAAKRLAGILLRADIPFSVKPYGNQTAYKFTIEEDNEQRGLVGKWADA